MTKKCELTGKNPLKGHKVSHANNKTKRRFLPNLKKVNFKSEILNRKLKLTVSNAGVRSVDKKGTFDLFLKTAKNKNLSPRLKKNIGFALINRRNRNIVDGYEAKINNDFLKLKICKLPFLRNK